MNGNVDSTVEEIIVLLDEPCDVLESCDAADTLSRRVVARERPMHRWMRCRLAAMGIIVALAAWGALSSLAGLRLAPGFFADPSFLIVAALVALGITRLAIAGEGIELFLRPPGGLSGPAWNIAIVSSVAGLLSAWVAVDRAGANAAIALLAGSSALLVLFARLGDGSRAWAASVAGAVVLGLAISAIAGHVSVPGVGAAWTCAALAARGAHPRHT